MENKTKIIMGYCCISALYPEIRCNRASTKTYLGSMENYKRSEYLIKKANENIKDLKELLKLNVQNDIYAFRLPEQLLPQLDLGYYSLEEFGEKLQSIGEIANKYKIQLSTHPSQYYVLNSLRKDVVKKLVKTLNLFADMFNYMKLNKIPNITLHIGGKGGYETRNDAIEAFCEGYDKLNKNAKKFLVIENDHVSFNIEDCLKINQKLNIPVVFDNKHFDWNNNSIDYDNAVRASIKTWGKRTPKLHLSSDKIKKTHAHSDYVELKDYIRLENAILKTNVPECYVMLECKKKDKAVIELKKEIKSNNINNDSR